jgi:hypothetical protein
MSKLELDAVQLRLPLVGEEIHRLTYRSIHWTAVNCHTMDRVLRRQRRIPRHYGYSYFNLEKETCVFEPWPVYLVKSFKSRFRQRRIAISNWLQKRGW